MPRQETLVDFDEIFKFAEKKYNIEWNDCCDIFHRNAIICTDEGRDQEFDIDELEQMIKDAKANNSKWFTPLVEKGYNIVLDFMKENKLEEMRVINDF
jgi:hypothetical protein